MSQAADTDTQTTGTLPEAGLLSVVIPHWNAVRFLPTCLEALHKQTYPHVEVIIADNNSTDGSKELVREQYPWVRLVELDRNYGFTGGCNAGIRAARGEYIALLNNDTEADPGWAAAVVDAFARHSEAGSIASKMLLFDRRDHIHAAGDFYTLDGLPGNRGVWQKDEGQFEQKDYVFSACAGASSYRRVMLDEIGLLDDDFFFSCEDVDLSWRAQFAGWRCLYTPRAIVYHHLSASGGGVTASYYTGRNTIYVIVKNYPAELWRKHGIAIIRAQAGIAWEALCASRGEAARARLRGMFAGIRHIPRMMKKRRSIQGGRRVTIAYIESILAPIQR